MWWFVPPRKTDATKKGRPSVMPERPPACKHRFSLGFVVLWDAQNLTGIDFVRVAEHRLVGLEYFHVVVGGPKRLFGDGRQIVALFDGVENRIVSAVVIHFCNAFDIAHGEDDFLAHFFGHGSTGDFNFVAFDLNIKALCIQTDVGYLFVQRVSRWLVGNFFAGLFPEIEQAHVVSPMLIDCVMV